MAGEGEVSEFFPVYQGQEDLKCGQNCSMLPLVDITEYKLKGGRRLQGSFQIKHLKQCEGDLVRV